MYYTFYVLCVNINTGTKTALKSQDLKKKTVRRNLTNCNVSRIKRQNIFQTHKVEDLKLNQSVELKISSVKSFSQGMHYFYAYVSNLF